MRVSTLEEQSDADDEGFVEGNDLIVSTAYDMKEARPFTVDISDLEASISKLNMENSERKQRLIDGGLLF